MSSFLQSISNVFGGSQQQQPPANQQPQNNQGPQNNQQPPQNNASGNPANPSQGVNTEGTNTPTDPVAMYNKMWENNTSKQGEEAPRLSIDPKVLDQVSGQLNFMQGVPEDLVQKATNGDTKALMELMNHVGKSAYRTSMQHQSAVTDAFVDQREGHFGKRIPGMFKDELTMNTLSAGSSKAPEYVRKQLSEIAKKIQAANPDASPDEVAATAKQYVADLNKAVIGEQSPTPSNGNNGPQEVDWDKYGWN